MKTMVDQYHKLGIGVCWLLQSTSSPMLVSRGLVGPWSASLQCCAVCWSVSVQLLLLRCRQWGPRKQCGLPRGRGTTVITAILIMISFVIIIIIRKRSLCRLEMAALMNLPELLGFRSELQVAEKYVFFV